MEDAIPILLMLLIVLPVFELPANIPFLSVMPRILILPRLPSPEEVAEGPPPLLRLLFYLNSFEYWYCSSSGEHDRLSIRAPVGLLTRFLLLFIISDNYFV